MTNESTRWHDVPAQVTDAIKSGAVASEWAPTGPHALVHPDSLTAAILYGSRRALEPVTAIPVDVLGFVLQAEKTAGENENASGLLEVPSIPVDAFNQVVWNDVNRQPNPWGSKPALGTNDSPLSTPAPVAATVTGILSGTAAMTGRRDVSALHVAMVAGEAAGRGWLGGLVLGKTLGALAGLSPESQDRLQRIGLWGGLLTGAVNAVFGRDAVR